MKLYQDQSGRFVADHGLGGHLVGPLGVRLAYEAYAQSPSPAPICPPGCVPAASRTLYAKDNVRCVGAPASDDPADTSTPKSSFYSAGVASGATTASAFCKEKGFRSGFKT